MSEQLTNNLTLAKGAVQTLLKDKGVEHLKAKVVLVFDYSISMSNLYARGFVQEMFERLFPIAMAMDDDESAEVYIFSTQAFRVLPDLTKDNMQGYIKDNIMSKYRMGGTSYAPFIEMITQNFLDGPDASIVRAKELAGDTSGGFLSWFKSKPVPVVKPTLHSVAEVPTFVLAFTDGDNDDKRLAEEAMIDASEHAIFWELVGMGRGPFPFLERLDNMKGRAHDNANFFAAPTDDLVKHSNAEFYGKLFTEFPGWVEEVTKAGILKPQK